LLGAAGQERELRPALHHVQAAALNRAVVIIALEDLGSGDDRVERYRASSDDKLSAAEDDRVRRTADPGDPAQDFYGAAGAGGVEPLPSFDAPDAAAADVRVSDGTAQYVFGGAAEHRRADRRAKIHDIDATAVEHEIAHSAAPHRYRAAALDDDAA